MLFLLLLLVSGGLSADDHEIELDDEWYKSETIPEVNIEEIIAELTQKYTWFWYIGNATMQCSESAKKMDTLMEAIGHLHDCLSKHYQACASEFAVQEDCSNPITYPDPKPCGALRMGRPDDGSLLRGYSPNIDCTWSFEVTNGFHINLTIDEFYLETSDANCSYDWVMVYDGHDNYSTAYGKYCGKLDKFTIYGSGTKMRIKAHTDSDVGKLGFRASYQIVEYGKGKTYSEPTKFWYQDTGSFSLKDYPPVRFEAYEEGYFYNEWHIKVNVRKRLHLDVRFKAAEANDTVAVHDGPWARNNIIQLFYHRQRFGEALEMAGSLNSTGFQVYIVLKQASNDIKCQLEVSWKSFMVIIDTLLSRGVPEEDCLGLPQIVLESDNNTRIGLPISATLKEDNKPIFCAWKIEAVDGFVHLDIDAFKVNGPFHEGCQYEGLVILNGGFFEEGDEQELLGPFCYDDPSFLFKQGNTKFDSVFSTGREMLVLYYSYVQYPLYNVAKMRGEFRAEVFNSQCQGLWQVCSSPTILSLFENENFHEITVQDNSSTSTRHSLINCHKLKCCVIQQFPTYKRASFETCTIKAGRGGDDILATTDFITKLLSSQKVSLSDLVYKDESKELDIHSIGRLRRLDMKGTMVSVTYTSRAIRSTGGFTIQSQPAQCGYYEPPYHKNNNLYAPCAEAYLHLGNRSFEISFIDSQPTPSKYYSFNFDYANNALCISSNCMEDIIEIHDNQSAIIFTHSDFLPLTWRTWGVDDATESRNWQRKVTVYRLIKPKCLPSLKTCDLRITFRTHEMDTIEDPGQEIPVQCPIGYTKVSTRCYKLVWPNEAPGELLNFSNGDSFSAEGASQACNNYGGHLAEIESAQMLDDLKNPTMREWWSKYFRFIPGAKSLYIGIEIEEGVFKWPNGKPVTFMNWGMPDYNHRRPDFMRTSHDWSKIQDFIYSQKLKQSARMVNPPMVDGRRCAVMMVDSAHSPFYWYVVPCNESIEGALPLCETAPSKVPEPKTVDGLGSYIQQRDELNILIQQTDVCDHDFVKVLDKCLHIAKSPSADVDQDQCDRIPVGDSPLKSKIARISKRYLPQLMAMVKILVSEYEQWGLIVHFSGTGLTLVDGTSVDAMYLARDGGEWELSFEQKRRQIRSMLCEIHTKTILDECAENHKRSVGSFVSFFFKKCFRCTDGTCILADQVCDGIKNCHDNSDEENCDPDEICKSLSGQSVSLDVCYDSCSLPECTCNEMYFQCHSGGCIPLSKLCNMAVDCQWDTSDEQLCIDTDCGDDNKCDNGKCFKETGRCDHILDCLDGTDERDCIPDDMNKCGFKNHLACENGQGICFPNARMDDSIPDCKEANPPDEPALVSFYSEASYKTGLNEYSLPKETDVCDGGGVLCGKYFGKCIDRYRVCQYDLDEFGSIKHCRQGTHLDSCEMMDCEDNFKCPNSYCLPIKRVCDGHIDCPGGQDESTCDNYICPGFFRCRDQTYCIRQNQVCDGTIDCTLHGEDEFLCELKNSPCPEDCACFGDAMRCTFSNNNENYIHGHSGIKGLILRDNKIDSLPSEVSKYSHLHRLDLSHNRITQISESPFEKMTVLRELYLHKNRIGGFSMNTFKGLTHLTKLTLHGNMISFLSEGAFIGLSSLTIVDLSFLDLQTLESHQFYGLESVEVINISFNHITTLKNSFLSDLSNGQPRVMSSLTTVDLRSNNIGQKMVAQDAFKYLPSNVTLYTDKFILCCFADHVHDCYPREDEFSSCFNLIRSRKVRFVIWLLGGLATLGNMVVLQQRTKHERESTPSLLVQHLSFADLLMGVYLITVACADEYYRGNFIINADQWRASAYCKLAGFLQMTSIEMSTFLVMLMAIDRVHNLVPSCLFNGISLQGVRGFIALGWTAATLTSVAPVLEFAYFGQNDLGFVRTGTCTTYNVIKGREMSGWEFSAALFVVFNFACYLVACVGFVRFMHEYRKGVDPSLPGFEIPEDMTDATDEEKEFAKEDELIFRENEMVITRRVFLTIATNFIIWLPLVAIGAMALYGYHVSTETSAWISVILVPINSAINPYLYAFSAKPKRARVDDLLRNWVEEEYDEEDDFMTRTLKDQSDCGTVATTKSDLPQSKSEAPVSEDV